MSNLPVLAMRANDDDQANLELVRRWLILRCPAEVTINNAAVLRHSLAIAATMAEAALARDAAPSIVSHNGMNN